MKKIYMYGMLFISVLCLGGLYTLQNKAVDTNNIESEDVIESEAQHVRNGLLIFLDDSEDKKSSGFVVDSFLKAILKKAGPIIVSASVIVNARDNNSLEEKDPQKVAARAIELQNNVNRTPENNAEFWNIIHSLAAFDTKKAEDWIIKEITNELYLLIPKEHLESRNIKPEDAKAFTKQDSLTPVELALGLKVNHMRTTHVMDIKESRCFLAFLAAQLRYPINPLDYCNYFIQSVWDSKNEESLIFVTNKDYKHYNKTAPLWSIAMVGHGMIGQAIVGLLLQDFKEFLTFLEKKINTSLLYYDSCYAAGVNNTLIYKDATGVVDKTYPFIIITQALTDAVTQHQYLFLQIENDVLKLAINFDYNLLLKAITTSDYIDYYKIGKLLVLPLEYSTLMMPQGYLGSLIPQVKLPGTEWFSVIDADRAVNIGNVLAKNRTKPLNIETFFARKGQKAKPLAILLYADDIPFELIVNTATQPAIVSMIPGYVQHQMKKVSSTSQSVDAIINSFLYFNAPWDPTKVFSIGKISGLNSPVMQRILSIDDSITELTLKNVTIITQALNVTVALPTSNYVSQKEYCILFTYNNLRYILDSRLTLETIPKVEEITEEKEEN